MWTHVDTYTNTVRLSPEADKFLVRLLLLAALLRLYKSLQMTASDQPPQLTGCLPTSLWQDLCNAHTESSDMEPGMRKIFTCVEEVNKCSLFTCWDQSHPLVLDLKACGGGGWMRWDERRLSATWRRGTLRMLRNGTCWWNCQINTLVREKSQHASMSLWSESEWGHLTSRGDTGKQTDVCVGFFTRLSVKSFVRSFSSNESASKKSTRIFINLSVNVLAYRLVIVDLR